MLAKPERMTIKNLFGTAFDADFGEHYLENNQSANNSIWMKKLNKLAKEAASENNPNDFVKNIFPELKAWLEKRDKAYQQYVRII